MATHAVLLMARRLALCSGQHCTEPVLLPDARLDNSGTSFRRESVTDPAAANMYRGVARVNMYVHCLHQTASARSVELRHYYFSIFLYSRE
jgi:hypothetical protein